MSILQINKFDIAEKDPMWNSYTDINELPPHYIREVSNFFEVYKSLEHNKQTAVKAICHRDEAMEVIVKCIEKYKETYGDK